MKHLVVFMNSDVKKSNKFPKTGLVGDKRGKRRKLLLEGKRRNP